MASAIRWLLLLSLSSLVLSTSSTCRGVRWLEESRSALVRLETPDLLQPPALWSPKPKKAQSPSQHNIRGLVFNFTLSHDNRTLLLNDVPILLVGDENVPAKLKAHYTTITDANEFEHANILDLDYTHMHLLDLDYYRKTEIPEDPQGHYNIYNPQLVLNILGAGVPGGNNTLLKNETQPIIRVKLEELAPYQPYPYLRTNSERFFKIADISLEDRVPYHSFPDLEEQPQCNILSWRCHDIEEYPYYRVIYRENFDEYGKIGSLRHTIFASWGTVCNGLGTWNATLLFAVVAGMVLAPMAFCMYQCTKRIIQHAKMKREDPELIAVCGEAEGLLYGMDREESEYEFDEEILEDNRKPEEV